MPRGGGFAPSECASAAGVNPMKLTFIARATKIGRPRWFSQSLAGPNSATWIRAVYTKRRRLGSNVNRVRGVARRVGARAGRSRFI